MALRALPAKNTPTKRKSRSLQSWPSNYYITLGPFAVVFLIITLFLLSCVVMTANWSELTSLSAFNFGDRHKLLTIYQRLVAISVGR